MNNNSFDQKKKSFIVVMVTVPVHLWNFAHSNFVFPKSGKWRNCCIAFIELNYEPAVLLTTTGRHQIVTFRDVKVQFVNITLLNVVHVCVLL